MKNFDFLKKVVVVVLTTIALTGCSRSLESMVEKMNEELPRELSDGMNLTKVSMEGEYLVFYSNYDEHEWQLDDSRFQREWKRLEKDPGLRKEMINNLLGSGNEFTEKLQKEKKGVKMVIFGEKSRESVSYTIANPGEL